MAHSGHVDGDRLTSAGFLHGLLHALSGADHILAMVMVELLAVRLGGRALWALPGAFVVAMVVGALAGAPGVAAAAVEGALVLSVVVLAIVLALRVRMPVGTAAALVAVIALVHGHAHAAEVAGGLSVAWLGGVLVSTAAFHAGGILAGLGFGGVAAGLNGRLDQARRRGRAGPRPDPRPIFAAIPAEAGIHGSRCTSY